MPTRCIRVGGCTCWTKIDDFLVYLGEEKRVREGGRGELRFELAF